MANEDVLRPGEHEVEVAVLDPENRPAFRKTVKVTVPEPKANAPMAIPVLAETIKVDGPAGRYRLAAHFLSGAAAAGGPVEFFVRDAAAMPPVKVDVALWGKEEPLEVWLRAIGIAFHALAEGAPRTREVIVIVGKGAGSLPDIARHMARGSTVVMLSPLPWPRWPLFGGKLHALDRLPGIYHRDDWNRRHAIFDGLPSGGLMDWNFYRNIVTANGMALESRTAPDEVVAGGINTVCPYGSGIYVGVYNLGAGRFIANALNIRSQLGRDPVAERLLRNMLNFAARDLDAPPAELLADFDKQRKAMGYE